MNISVRSNPPIPPGTIAPVPAGATMPVGEQIRFLSGRTGAWVLDTYLEMAELGNRTIADLLSDLFDQNGVLILSGLNNWLGIWQPGQSYHNGDTFSNPAGDIVYVAVRPHISTDIASDYAAGNIEEVITAPYGPPGPPGPAGPTGPQGPPGQTVQLIGAFGQTQTPANLPASGLIPANWDAPGVPPSAYQFSIGQGMAYKPANTSDPLYGHIFDYVGTNVTPSGWIDEGAVQGPPGPAGQPGAAYVVVAHLVTAPPDVNNPPISPPTGLLVIDLDDASHGQASIPAGGTTGQVLAKHSGTDYDTAWQTIPAGPQGPPGTPGAPGATGPAGPPGAAGTVPEAPTDGQVYGRKGQATASWLPALPITGGTLTGPLTINPAGPLALTVKGVTGTQFVIDKPASTAAVIYGQSVGKSRWNITLGNATTEAGTNSGSDFSINAYTDAGAALYQPFFISRATGQVKINVTNSASNYNPHLDSPTGIAKALLGSVNSQDRWAVILGNATAESGGNAGSDFGINRYSDAGAYLGTPIFITRSNGNVAIAQAMTVGGSLSAGGNFSAAQINGTAIVASANMQVNTPAGTAAWHYAYVAGVRQWLWGCQTDGTFLIYDASAPRSCLGIATNGTVIVYNSLTVNGSLNTNAISGTTITASANFNATGTNGVIYLSPPGYHQWYVGGMNNNQLYITDVTANAVRLAINDDGAGRVSVEQALYVGNGATVTGSVNASGNVIASGVVQGQGDAGVQCVSPGGNARFYSYGGHVWYFGSDSAGNFNVYDASTNAMAYFDTGASLHCPSGAFIGSCNINSNGFSQSWQSGNYHGFSSSGTQMTFWRNGSPGGSWNFNAPSDERLKDNIAPSRVNALDELNRIELVSFDEAGMRDPAFQATHVDCGFSAQKMRDAIPEAVTKTEFPNARIADGVALNIDIMPLLARCIGAIQQLTQRIEALER